MHWVILWMILRCECGILIDVKKIRESSRVVVARFKWTEMKSLSETGCKFFDNLSNDLDQWSLVPWPMSLNPLSQCESWCPYSLLDCMLSTGSCHSRVPWLKDLLSISLLLLWVIDWFSTNVWCWDFYSRSRWSRHSDIAMVFNRWTPRQVTASLGSSGRSEVMTKYLRRSEVSEAEDRRYGTEVKRSGYWTICLFVPDPGVLLAAVSISCAWVLCGFGALLHCCPGTRSSAVISRRREN